jgi:hypothetical protein
MGIQYWLPNMLQQLVLKGERKTLRAPTLSRNRTLEWNWHLSILDALWVRKGLNFNSTELEMTRSRACGRSWESKSPYVIFSETVVIKNKFINKKMKRSWLIRVNALIRERREEKEEGGKGKRRGEEGKEREKGLWERERRKEKGERIFHRKLVWEIMQI